MGLSPSVETKDLLEYVKCWELQPWPEGRNVSIKKKNTPELGLDEKSSSGFQDPKKKLQQQQKKVS